LISPFIPKSRITDSTKVGLEFSIDGKVKQSGTTVDMIFDVPSLISFVSGIMRLEVGPLSMFAIPILLTQMWRFWTS
jgi:acylpyruvate hydrolase